MGKKLWDTPEDLKLYIDASASDKLFLEFHC